MSKKFSINTEYELGNAIWESIAGDTIEIKSGKYGWISFRDGVNIIFENNASVAGIAGLDINGGGWGAGSVYCGTTLISNPRLDPENINCMYEYIVSLPTNCRLANETTFLHANGSFIKIFKEGPDGFVLNSNLSALSQLPKSTASISVPVLEKFDVKMSAGTNSGGIEILELPKILKHDSTHHDLRIKAEKYSVNRVMGLSLNEFDYRALWALNDFLTAYSREIKSHARWNFSVTSFLDGLRTQISDNKGEVLESRSQAFIREFSNIQISQDSTSNLQTSLLSIKARPIKEMTQYHLEQLEYHFAVLGMYQQFEIFWEDWKNGRTQDHGKWKFIAHKTNDLSVRSALAEMINARNWIAHHGLLKTEGFGRNYLKTEVDWGASAMNQYEIFARKKPWVWNEALRNFSLLCA
jgi:hypothetical protein